MAGKMSYQVIARRWRPQNFDEVLEQDHVLTTIKNSIKNGRISHSYIFTGARGVGKTTTARILAKSLNCVNGPTPDPCGVCDNCVEIKNGSSFDVIEIDGASNNSVDNIRDLREKVNFAPVKSKYKVYIIDEVHMLSTGAFNALLKTLEEPPPHVVFIFATTELHKVPDTILSRCQKFYFKKMHAEPVAAHLKKILISEKIPFQETAIYPIARAADGSMRDAQSLLEQVIAFADGEITEAVVHSVLGVVSVSSYTQVLSALEKNDPHALISEVTKISESGYDITRFIQGIADVIRYIRLARSGALVRDAAGYSDDEVKAIMAYADSFSDEELSLFFKIIKELQQDLRHTDNERVAAEMAFMDMLAVRGRPSISQIIQKLEEGFDEKKKPETVRPAFAKPEPQKPASEKPALKSAPETMHQFAEAKQETEKISHEKSLKEEWVGFMDRIRVVKQYLFNRLKGLSVSFDDDALVFNDPHEAAKLLDARDCDFIREELSKHIGRTIRLVISANDDAPGDDSGLVDDDAPLPDAMMERSDVNDIEIITPVVQKILDIFHGEIVKPEKNKGEA
jgi:DNA polymerase III subunit gamma/tau